MDQVTALFDSSGSTGQQALLLVGGAIVAILTRKYWTPYVDKTVATGAAGLTPAQPSQAPAQPATETAAPKPSDMAAFQAYLTINAHMKNQGADDKARQAILTGLVPYLAGAAQNQSAS